MPRNLRLIGYGKMGRRLSSLRRKHGFEVALRLRQLSNKRMRRALQPKRFAGIDVAIEFTTPEAALENLKRLAALQMPVVTGTTGWLEHLNE